MWVDCSKMRPSAVLYLLPLAALSIISPTISATHVTTIKRHAITEFITEELNFQWTIQDIASLSGCETSPTFSADINSLKLTFSFCKEDSRIDRVQYNLKRNNIQNFQGTLLVTTYVQCNGFSDMGRWNIHSDYGSEIYVCDIPNDIFCENITLTTTFSMPPITVSKIIAAPESSDKTPIKVTTKGHLSEDLGRLLKNANFSDTQLLVQNETFFAHRSILAIRSPAFAEELIENKNQVLKVSIQNIELAVMSALLEYIYTDHVDNLDDLSLTFGLVRAADRFKLPHLTTLCEQVLYESLDADSAADLLVLADRYGMDALKTETMQFIRDHFPDVMKTDGYKNMKNKSPALLMEILFSAKGIHF